MCGVNDLCHAKTKILICPGSGSDLQKKFKALDVIPGFAFNQRLETIQMHLEVH